MIPHKLGCSLIPGKDAVNQICGFIDLILLHNLDPSCIALFSREMGEICLLPDTGETISSQPGFLAQFKVWKTKEYCMYPQGVCRIRKPAYAGNGCAIFLVFQTEEVGQKDGCGSQTQLRGVALTKIKMKNLLILTCNIRRSMVAFTY